MAASKTITIGFLGGGNMAGALIGGLVKKLSPEHVHVTDRHPEKLERLRSAFGVAAHETAGDWVAGCDLFVLAVKPQGMKAAAGSVAALLNPKGAALSIAAGIEGAALSAWLGGYPVLRAMPNTPAMAGCGATGLWAPSGAPAEALAWSRFLLSAVGEVVEVETEDGIDLVGAISGSGPAYVFRFMEALQAAGAKRGLSEADAKMLALSTVCGAAALARESGEEFAQLRKNVTSKGGTTAKALEVLDARDISGIMDEAVQAALDRTAEMRAMFR